VTHLDQTTSHFYRGKLAPVSGSIDASDADAYAAAARELREETQLDPNTDLRMMYCGTTFTFADEEAQRSWTVHPFSWWLLSNESKIKLDWEHDGYEWKRPQGILSREIVHDCVPRLDWSFRRVYFGHGGIFGHDTPIRPDNEPGRLFERTLRELRDDKKNGAKALASHALQRLALIAESMEVFDWSSLTRAAYHFTYSGRPSMNAAISSTILQALADISSMARESRVPGSPPIAERLRCISDEREQPGTMITSSLTDLVRQSLRDTQQIDILTLSRSSTIIESIKSLLSSIWKLNIKLSILESRPLCEGVSAADTILHFTSLHRDRIHISLAPDSHLSKLAQDLRHPSFLLLGADRISPSGHVSNKMGSTAAAIVVKHLSPKTKIVVLSETAKITKPSDLELYERNGEDISHELKEHSPESGDLSEVTEAWDSSEVDGLQRYSNVDVQNVYFEWVYRDLIDTYVTEEGVTSRERIRDISLRNARLEKEIFGGL
jgi:translation initiation factor 2B subunit (eIF-2B alpha/beta/delta family)/8-oxo-dGTP pyrophosphatase MutT (NUDIX family)